MGGFSWNLPDYFPCAGSASETSRVRPERCAERGQGPPVSERRDIDERRIQRHDDGLGAALHPALSDKILIAFHQACDQADFEVAERLLKVVEMVLAVPRPIDRERREQETLVAAYERLWQLRHPNAGEEA